jgi:hypothetical protein
MDSSLLQREINKLAEKTPKRKNKKRKQSKNLSLDLSKTNGVPKKAKSNTTIMGEVTFSKQPQSTPMVRRPQSSSQGSIEEGKLEFQKLIDPVSIDDFMK